jgi:hypothetical protein
MLCPRYSILICTAKNTNKIYFQFTFVDKTLKPKVKIYILSMNKQPDRKSIHTPSWLTKLYTATPQSCQYTMPAKGEIWDLVMRALDPKHLTVFFLFRQIHSHLCTLFSTQVLQLVNYLHITGKILPNLTAQA